MYETRPERLPKSSLSPLPQVNLFVILPHTCIGAPRRRRALCRREATADRRNPVPATPHAFPTRRHPPFAIGTPGGKPHVLTEGSGADLLDGATCTGGVVSAGGPRRN